MKLRQLVWLAGCLCVAVVVNAAEKIWIGAVDNNWNNPNNWLGGLPGSNDAAIFETEQNQVTVTATTRILKIEIRTHAVGTVINIAEGVTLGLFNYGLSIFDSSENAVINGPGFLEFSTAGGTDYADWRVLNKSLLVINAPIIANGDAGFEHNHDGHILLNNPDSNFAGHVIITHANAVLAFPAIANKGMPSPMGSGSLLYASHPSTFRFTGSAPSSTDRDIELRHTSLTLEQAGSAALTWNGNVFGTDNNGVAKTFVLAGDTMAPATFSGYLVNGSGGNILSLAKRGLGTWRVSGAGSATGDLVVEDGTLIVQNQLAFTKLRLKGGVLELDHANPLPAMPEVELRGGFLRCNLAWPQVSNVRVTGSATLDLRELNSIVTLPALSLEAGGVLNVLAADKVMISGMGAGALPNVIINGVPAAYDTTQGIIAYAGATTSVPAYGPFVINSAANTALIIDAQGTSGGISLGDTATTILGLGQYSPWEALVTFDATQTLVTPVVGSAPNAAGLTLGTIPGVGQVTAPNRTLNLNVGDNSGGVTINAIVADRDPGTALAVTKVGAGAAHLYAPEFGDKLALGEGALSLEIPAGQDKIWSGLIEGSGTLVKEGAGRLVMTNTRPDFIGPIEINEGTLSFTETEGLGLSSSNRVIAVSSGAALDVGSGLSDNLRLAQLIFAAGAGPDGGGALLNSSTNINQGNSFQRVTLTDDLSIGGNSRLDIRLPYFEQGWLDLKGHTLTKVSSNFLAIVNAPIIPDDPALPDKYGTIDHKGGTLSVEFETDFNGSEDNVLNLYPDSIFMLYGLSRPIKWSVNAAEGAIIRAGSRFGPYRNIFAGPVNLQGPGATVLDQSVSGSQVNFVGPVTGVGGLLNRSGQFHLLNCANDYQGDTVVSNTSAFLHTDYPDALPGWREGRVSVVSGGNLSVRMGDTGDDGWTQDEVEELLAGGSFKQPKTTLKIDTELLSAPSISFSEPLNVGLHKVGSGDILFDKAFTSGFRLLIDEGTVFFDHPGPHYASYTRTYTGNLVLRNAAELQVNEDTVYLGDLSRYRSLANLITDNASLQMPDRGSWVGTGKLIVGQHGHAVLDITGNARVTAALLLGNEQGSGGAIYQSGNSIVTNFCGGSNDGRIGVNGYGYYELASGELLVKGYNQLGMAKGALGIYRQTGGKLIFGIAPDVKVGELGDYYGGNFTAGREGRGSLLFLGGEVYYGKTWNSLGDSGFENGEGDVAITFGGDAYVKLDGGSMDVGILNSPERSGLVNFADDAIFHARRIWGSGNASQRYYNFNGGTFLMNTGDNDSNLGFFSGTHPTRATLYGRGATFEVPENYTKVINISLSAPEGYMLADTAFDTPITGYYAPPLPVLHGQGGRGGYVDPVFDRASGSVSGLKVISPGFNYLHEGTTVTLKGGGRDDITVAVNVEQAKSGGFIKKGAGNLILKAANFYSGPTRVLAGTLGIEHAAALPHASTIEVGGSAQAAALNLGGHTITNANIILKDGGMIVGGSLVGGQIRKVGSGRAELALATKVAPEVVFADADKLEPGFQEGMIRASWMDNVMNPGANVQLTTVAANGPREHNSVFAGGRWAGDNHTWIYTGYIWNHTDENVSWQVRGSFDDSVSLWLDDSTQRVALSGSEATTLELTPGPHLVRMYFGDGSGNAGNWHDGLSGLEINRNDGNDWQPFSDPGDGSFATVSQAPWGTFWQRLAQEPSQAGLWEGVLTSACNTVDPNPMTSIQQTTRAANGSCNENESIEGFHWPNYSTAIYSGYLWNHVDHDVTWTFIEAFDDYTLLKIDGEVVFNSTAWNTVSRGSYTLTPGAHFFEVRFGQAIGGAGLSGGRPNWWPGMPEGKGSFLVDFQGRNSENIADYELLANPPEGLPLLTTGPTLPGIVDEPESYLLVEEGTLGLGARPGLYEGMIPQNDNTQTPNPKTSVQLTTRAGNGPLESNLTYNHGMWAGGNHTWIYTGYIWNRTPLPVIYSFWASFDDAVRLYIDGTEILHGKMEDEGMRTMTELTPGPHAIEIRYSDGYGDVGPHVKGLPGGLCYSTQVGSSDPAAYQVLADPGDGSFLTTELDIDYSTLDIELMEGSALDLNQKECSLASIGGTGTISNGGVAANTVWRVKIEGESSSCLYFDNLDVSNLTIVPADAASAEPTHHTYKIAEGDFTGKPTLSGFPVKFKLQIRDNQMMLTSMGGAVLLLR